eukprot:scaffold34621_cov166-Amphora_coffeaeformis.AAC.5
MEVFSSNLYVMEGQHRDIFLTGAGAAWQQLILPWLSKYRVFGVERREQALEAIRKREKLKKEEDDVNSDDGNGEKLY